MMKQTTTWVVIANASRARVYVSGGQGVKLERVREYAHAQSRAKGTELLSDRPGHAASGRGARRTALEPDTQVKRHEQERFAHEIALALGTALKENQFDQLVLIASAAFLGMLKSALPKGVVRVLTHTEGRDLTNVPEAELDERVRGLLSPR